MTKPRIMVAPNGARRKKSDHPALPITAQELALTARDCARAGADALHLHVRNATAEHSLSPALYREAIAAIGALVPDLPIQITTEAMGIYSPKEQFDCIKALGPQRVSISLKEISQDTDIASKIYHYSEDINAEIQHILYDQSDIAGLVDWQKRGWIPSNRQHVLLVLGRYEEGPASQPEAIEPLVQSLPEVASWMVCAFGPQEHACLRRAAAMGGDIRVGFENAIEGPDGQIWKDNAASVRALSRSLKG